MNAIVRALKTPAEEALSTAFDAAKPSLRGFPDARLAAMRGLEETGLPHRRVEAWKYSDLRAVMRDLKPLADAPSIETLALAGLMPEPFADFAAPTLVFVDGYHVPELGTGALPAGVEVVSLAHALATGHPLLGQVGRLQGDTPEAPVAMNTAFLREGALVRVAAGVKLAQAIQLDFRFTGQAAAIHPRVLVVVEGAAEAQIVESHRGRDGVAYQSIGVSEAVLGENARLTHIKLQVQGDQALHLATAFVHLAAGAHYASFALEEGSAFCRRDVFVRFTGEGASIALKGATLATGRQHIDTTLVVDHEAGGCDSRETYKYVLAQESRGVFQGKIIVRPHAQKTDGRMSARALLLEEGPEFDAKPELEIYADDVQCAHGATAGELDEDLMFYLRARGIPEGEAKALLVRAFVGEALEAVEDDAIRDALATRIETWLSTNLK